MIRFFSTSALGPPKKQVRKNAVGANNAAIKNPTQPFRFFFLETSDASVTVVSTPLDKSIQNHHLNRDSTRSFYVDFKEGGNAKIAR